jgi:hypothetical protein
MATDVNTVSQALTPLRTGVQADGYDLEVRSVENGVAHVLVVAGPNACKECLVPKPIMAGTIKMSLRSLPEITRVELTYPLDQERAT